MGLNFTTRTFGMIELHTAPTPNGQKVMILLEEANIEYEFIMVNIRTGEHFTTDYLKLSPNNKIPAIVDTDGPGRGRYTMMESGAILVYLAKKCGQFMPDDERVHYDILQWLMFQMGHVGPMFGQANHFNNYAKEDVAYAKNRYNNEVLRLYKVLDNRLRESAYIGHDQYSIADMAIYPWAKMWESRGLDLDSHPHFKRWVEELAARPAVAKVNEDATRIRAEMQKAAEGQAEVDIYDTKKNAEMLAEATK